MTTTTTGLGLTVQLSGPFEAALTRVIEALKTEGFGVLTEIDVQATMKKKIDADMPAYLILGACNPKLAWRAIGVEPKIGAMLPCNVIVRQTGGSVTVSAVDPVASMEAVANADLKAVAGEVRGLLAAAVQAI